VKYVKCKNCLMGSLGGINWYRAHVCPDPYPSHDIAAVTLANALSGALISQRERGRLVISWRAGLLPELDSCPLK
jgi:hypothetical protein